MPSRNLGACEARQCSLGRPGKGIIIPQAMPVSPTFQKEEQLEPIRENVTAHQARVQTFQRDDMLLVKVVRRANLTS